MTAKITARACAKAHMHVAIHSKTDQRINCMYIIYEDDVGISLLVTSKVASNDFTARSLVVFLKTNSS